MRTIDDWLNAYGESHQNDTNKLIHWICVPIIMFSILGLLYSIPVVGQQTLFYNWAMVAVVLILLFYLRLSFSIFIGFVVVGFLMVLGNHLIARSGISLPLLSIILFVLAWIGQFYGHNVEGKKPSFFEDLQFLLIGPAWLMHFAFKKLGIDYH